MCTAMVSLGRNRTTRTRSRSSTARAATWTFKVKTSGTNGFVSWEDDAWAEFNHELYYYRLDSEDKKKPWVKYDTATTSKSVGGHVDMADQYIHGSDDKYKPWERIFRQTISLAVHSSANYNDFLPEKTAYMVCGRANFWQIQPSTEHLRCSDEMESSNEAHNKCVVLDQYDESGNGRIDRAEATGAVSDYFAGKITIDQAIVVLRLFSG